MVTYHITFTFPQSQTDVDFSQRLRQGFCNLAGKLQQTSEDETGSYSGTKTVNLEEKNPSSLLPCCVDIFLMWKNKSEVWSDSVTHKSSQLYLFKINYQEFHYCLE